MFFYDNFILIGISLYYKNLQTPTKSLNESAHKFFKELIKNYLKRKTFKVFNCKKKVSRQQTLNLYTLLSF